MGKSGTRQPQWLVAAVGLVVLLACGEPPSLKREGTAESTTATLQTAQGRTSETTKKVGSGIQAASVLPITTPRIWPELTTDALNAARAKLPKDAPEDAYIDSRITPGKKGGKLVYGYTAEIKSFNPVLADSAVDQEAQALMFGMLIGYDSYQQQYIPGLAKAWSYDQPTKTWTFRLRKGIKWSDGHALTADDFIFFTQVIFDPKVPNPYHFMYRREPKTDSPPYSFSAPDPYTLQVTIPTEDAFSFNSLAGLGPLPRHALEKAWKEGRYTEVWLQNVDPKDLVVCGPYKLKQLRQGESIIFERNPNYWVYDVEGQQLPYIDELILQNVPDFQAEHVRFLAGDFDLMEENVGVYPDMLPKYIDSMQKGNFTVYALGASLNIDHYFFNVNRGGTYIGADGKQATWQPDGPDDKPGPEIKNFKPFVDPVKFNWFSNPEFRRACSEATNRQRMIDTVLYGQGRPLLGSESSANKEWYNPDANKYAYNLASAKARLDKLGWTDRDGDGIREDETGHPIKFTISTNRDNPIRTKVQQLLVEDLRAAGIGAEQQVLEFNNLITRLRSSFDYDCAMLGFATGIPPHPAGGFNTWPSTGENHIGYPNQKRPMAEWESQIDALYAQMKHTFDPKMQQTIFFEMQRIYNEQLPAVGLFTRNAFTAARNKIGNLKPTIMRVSVTQNVDELYIK